MAGLNTSVMFAEGVKRIADGTIDLDTNVVRALLVKKSFANTTLTETAKDTFDFLDDIPSGDRSKDQKVIVTTKDLVKSNADDKIYYAGGTTKITFTVVPNGVSCRGIVVFASLSANETGCPLISYNHFTANVTADGGSVDVNFDANGLIKFSYV